MVCFSAKDSRGESLKYYKTEFWMITVFGKLRFATIDLFNSAELKCVLSNVTYIMLSRQPTKNSSNLCTFLKLFTKALSS